MNLFFPKSFADWITKTDHWDEFIKGSSIFHQFHISYIFFQRMVDDEKVLLLFLSWISIIFLCHNDKSVKRGVSYASSFFYVFNILILDYFQSFAFCEYFKIGSDALTMELLHHLCVLGVLLALKYNHFIVSCLLIVFVSMLYNKTYIYLLVFVVNSLFSKWKSCHGDSNACDGTVRLTACGFIMTLALVVSCYHVEDMPMDNFVRWLAGMVEHMVESIWDYELNIVTIFERMSCNRVGAQWSATPKHYYEPGIGIWWYLHAQVFSSYDCYFQYLLHCQPALYVLPLVARFQPSGWCSQIIVSFICISKCM